MGIKINRNMRCIEMMIAIVLVIQSNPINRNMRCIEMVETGMCILSYNRD